MTMDRHMGWGFLLLWLAAIWSGWRFTEKNHLLERLFRPTEIGFFLMPVSAIVLSFRFGASALESGNSGAAQAGAVIGNAIGGTFIVGIAFVIGIVGGIIFHLVARKYEKKAESSGSDQDKSLSSKHGVVLVILVLFVLSVAFSFGGEKDKTPPSGQTDTAPAGSQQQDEPGISNVPEVPRCPQMANVGLRKFEYAESISGGERFWLDAQFLKPADFSDVWVLDNSPTQMIFSSDNFVCDRGKNIGQSVNKLYRVPTISYTPKLRRNNVDSDGNITDTENLYIKEIIFDVTDTGIEDAAKLNTFDIEGIECDESYY